MARADLSWSVYCSAKCAVATFNQIGNWQNIFRRLYRLKEEQLVCGENKKQKVNACCASLVIYHVASAADSNFETVS